MAQAYSPIPTKRTRSAASAAWPLDTLVGALARRGWGDLAEETQGVRTVLHALVAVLPHGSAEGCATAHQLADVCGLSERWVRRCLARLEVLGVITWRRGWIERGRKVPSVFRVAKRRLAAWIRRATGTLDERRTERNRIADERVDQLRTGHIPPTGGRGVSGTPHGWGTPGVPHRPPARRRTPRQAELGAALPPSREVTPAPTGPPVPWAQGIATCRAALAHTKGLPR